MTATLYYVHDPMCSWCWAFRPVLSQLISRMPRTITVVKLLGGLAPDTNEPMPETMQELLQRTWRRIEQSVPGTRFNYDFWKYNNPRRATYPACRAVLAAREQGVDEAMLEAIQNAYYLQARNPSDNNTLQQLAGELGLDTAVFAEALDSERIQQRLVQEIERARTLGADSFPSLVLEINGSHWPVPVDYLDPGNILANIEWMLEGS